MKAAFFSYEQPGRATIISRLLAGLVLVALLFAPAVAPCREDSTEAFQITADRLTTEAGPERIIAEGNVILQSTSPRINTLKIRADQVTFLTKTAKIQAAGNVRLSETGSEVFAEGAEIDLKSQTGSLTATTIYLEDQELHFTGEVIEKIGESSFRFKNGTVSSCRATPRHHPDWSINCREATVTMEGMAYLKHAIFKIRSLPVLYTPFIALPAKTTRQSGFLFPEFSQSSRDGTGLITPLFIALSPSSDLTIYPGYLQDRGPLLGLEGRFIASRDTLGTVFINTLKDRTVDPGPAGSDGDYHRDGLLRTNPDRYWISGKADHYFSRKTALHLDLDLAGDHDFLDEFRDGIAGFDQVNGEYRAAFNRGLQEATIPFRESTLQLSAAGEQSSGGVELRYVDDLREAAGTTIHTLPRITSSIQHNFSRIPGIFNLDSEYLHYAREGGDGYHRLDLSPEISLPIPAGPYIEGTITGGIRETLYRMEAAEDSRLYIDHETFSRRSWEITARAATTLAKSFKINGREEQRINHSIRPVLTYSILESSDQTALPSMDQEDRIAGENRLSWELNHYFRLDRSSTDSPPLSRELGSLKLSQSYSINEQRRQLTGLEDRRTPFSDLDLDLEIYPARLISLRYQTALNVYGEGIAYYDIEGSLRDNRGDTLGLDYAYHRGISRDLALTAGLRITDSLAARYAVNRSLDNHHTTSEKLTLLYNRQCWGVELNATKDSEDTSLRLLINLTGIGTAWEWNQSGI